MKRAFDIFLSLLVLSISSPLFLLVAIAIKLESRGPVFFKHERVGLNSQRFQLYKFRTMVENAAQIGPNITREGDPRITRVGKLLRSWKIDELPQFINVLRGEMSVVGPRPETPDYVALYTPEQRRVLSMRPGMAGLAFVAYRNEEKLLAQAENPRDFYINHIMPEKLKLDLEYVDNQSFLHDLKIIVRAFRAVIFE